MSKIMDTKVADIKAFMRLAASPSPSIGMASSSAVAASQLKRPCRKVIRAVRYSKW